MTQKPVQPVERPAVEPEIIPPERSRSAWNRFDAPEGGFFNARYRQRVYVAKIGPWGMVLLAALAILVVAAILVFVIGALLVWIPVIALLAIAGIVFASLRRYFARLR
jgi:hypothetical protein